MENSDIRDGDHLSLKPHGHFEFIFNDDTPIVISQEEGRINSLIFHKRERVVHKRFYTRGT